MGLLEDALLMMKFMQSYGMVMHRTMEDILAEIEQQQKSFKVVYIGQQSSKIRMHLLKLVINVKEQEIYQRNKKCHKTIS
ncbi:hypothetical protein PIB30_111801 [Stylosanthes scabra]|uniref:Uncharacterized protein n=1 Tax=Stylosanthes scabra TaxID=79078 RepID=A0ABU6Z236_9FABA|nr:hypothetical protein [Stylosanthes scabra]